MALRRSKENEFHARCRVALDELWERVSVESIDHEFDTAIRDSVADLLRAPTGISSTYRFVLPTQLLAKFVDPTLDARTIQKGIEGEESSFDARTLARHVIVPFNRRLGSPLGAAGDPYVNNPVRVPEITARFRPQQKDKPRWDALCRILDDVQVHNLQTTTKAALCQVLVELRRLLEETQVVYAPPQRISLEGASELVRQYLLPRSGGRRLQAVAFAFFRTVADQWKLYDEVLSAPATAPDTQAARPADIDCRRNGITVLAVEIKDRTLTLELLEDKITSTRVAKVRELLFLIRANPIVADSRVTERVQSEFASGQNIYVLDAEPFFNHVMALIGETGRAMFIEQVGKVIEELNLDYTDRRVWANLLTSG